MPFQSATRTDVGLRRKANEDAVCDRSEIGFWAVADGMGGEDAGEVASGMIVDTFQSLVSEGAAPELATDARRQVETVNKAIYDLANSGPVRRTIGSTVVGLAIAKGRFDCFWVGDSRAYLIRQRRISRLTRDHSLVEDLIRAEMLKPEDAENHPDSNVITRAVGVAAEVEIDSVEGEALPDDIFLLASDGLTRVVKDQELLEIVTRNNPMQAADRLLETVLERGAPDNVSLIVVRVA